MTYSAEVIVSISLFFGGILVSLIGFYWKTRQGNHVFLEKVKETSLIEISDKVKENLKITYKDKEVSQLKLFEYILYNDGYKDIKDFSIDISFNPDPFSEIIEWQVIDNYDKTIVEETGRYSNNLSISRPYLNMRKKYKDEFLTIQVFSNSELKTYISGSGEGWNFLQKVKSNNFLKKTFYLLFVSLFTISITFFIVWLLNIAYFSLFEIAAITFIPAMIFYFSAIRLDR